MMRSINLFDAAGLSLFCVTGTAVAFAHGLGPFQSTILGAITAVGGGTIRDVIIRRVPTVLTSGLYAVPALVGAAITAVALDSHFYGTAVALAAAFVCFAIRLAGLRYNLNVPIARCETRRHRGLGKEDRTRRLGHRAGARYGRELITPTPRAPEQTRCTI